MIPYCILAIEDPSDREFMTELFFTLSKVDVCNDTKNYAGSLVDRRYFSEHT